MGKKRDAPSFDWDAALAEIDRSPAARETRERRHLSECWEIAYDFLQHQDYLDEEGAPVDDPPDDWMEMASSLVATGVWLGMVAADDLDFIKHGGHEIANRLRRFRSRLATDPDA